jgi:hypothetical protein
MAAIFNIPDQYNGDSFDDVTFNFYVNSTDTQNDLSGATPKIQIRNKKDLNTVVETWTIGDGLAWVDQSGGSLKISKSGTIDWGAGTYLYDLQLTDGGRVKTYLKGYIKVLSEITV